MQSDILGLQKVINKDTLELPAGTLETLAVKTLPPLKTQLPCLEKSPGKATGRRSGRQP